MTSARPGLEGQGLPRVGHPGGRGGCTRGREEGSLFKREIPYFKGKPIIPRGNPLLHSLLPGSVEGVGAEGGRRGEQSDIPTHVVAAIPVQAVS